MDKYWQENFEKRKDLTRGMRENYHKRENKNFDKMDKKRILKRDSSRALCHRPASPPMAAAVSPEEDLINEWRRKVDQSECKGQIIVKGMPGGVCTENFRGRIIFILLDIKEASRG